MVASAAPPVVVVAAAAVVVLAAAAAVVVLAAATAVVVTVISQFYQSGYVQTLDHDKGEYCSGDMDTWAQIAPPLHHVTFVSMRRLAVKTRPPCIDQLGVYNGGRDREHRVWALCVTNVTLARVLYARVVHVHFKTGTWSVSLGFRLVFTHHLVRSWKASCHGNVPSRSVAVFVYFTFHQWCRWSHVKVQGFMNLRYSQIVPVHPLLQQYVC